jgi:hypothetical protein
VVIPRDVPLWVVGVAVHQDGNVVSGGYFTFVVAIGPHFTDLGQFNGTTDYGVLHLQFGLDGEFQDEWFDVSPAYPPEEESISATTEIVEAELALAEKREKYNP